MFLVTMLTLCMKYRNFFLCPLILSFFLFLEIITQAICYKIIILVTVSFYKLYLFKLLLLSRNGLQRWKKISSKFQFVCIFLFSLSASFFIFFVCVCVLYSLVCVFWLSFGVILFPSTGSFLMCHCRMTHHKLKNAVNMFSRTLSIPASSELEATRDQNRTQKKDPLITRSANSCY